MVVRIWESGDWRGLEDVKRGGKENLYNAFNNKDFFYKEKKRLKVSIRKDVEKK